MICAVIDSWELHNYGQRFGIYVRENVLMGCKVT